jgi:NTP pyrophosphatase (non-canonical NTP hydrolase)
MSQPEEKRVQFLRSQKTSNEAGGAESSGGAENLDKIRDILFGNQVRDHERRFNRLEERLIKEAGDARDDSRRRFDTLESYVKKEFESLLGRMQAEHEERTQALVKLERDLQQLADSLGKKLAQLDEHSSKSHREVREQILEQSKNLSDEIGRKHEEVSASLAREAEDLRQHKLDRASLASLLAELSLRINDDSGSADGE